MVKSLIIAAALAAAGASAPILNGEIAPAAAGEWRLSEVGGRTACTLTLSSDKTAVGYTVMAPLACRRAFPPLKDLAAWSVDPQGAIVFSDLENRRIAVFASQPGPTYEAKSPDGKTWRLEGARAPHALSAHERMTGAFRLTGAGGTVLCDLSLTANLFGDGGSVTPGQCAGGWNDKAFAMWSLQHDRLTFYDAARKPLLVLRTQDPVTFVAADPKAEAVTLVRR